MIDYGTHFVVFFEDGKTDGFREGNECRFEDSGDPLGVANLLRKLLGMLPKNTANIPIFRRIGGGKLSGQHFRSVAVGRSTLDEAAKKALIGVGENPADYGLHSYRAGAASLVANATNAAGEQLVPTALQEKHGRWAPGSKARAGYVEDSEEAKAIVPGLLKL